jgi:hypothetical protein
MAKILFCRQKFSNFSIDKFSPFELNFFFFYLKSHQMVLNQHIRRKKEEEKNCDVKLLTTNRTTVPGGVSACKILASYLN